MTGQHRKPENISLATILATASATFAIVILLGLVWLAQLGGVA